MTQHPFVGQKMVISEPAHMHRGRVVVAARLIPIRVMAVAEGYAMVRLPRAAPFVVAIDRLSAPAEAGGDLNPEKTG